MKKLLVITGLGALLLSSCYQYSATPAYSGGSASSGNRSEKNTDALTQNTDNTPVDRLVKFTADMRIDTKEPDTVMVHVSKMAKKYGGYIQSMSNGVCAIRVRSENFLVAVNEVTTFGKVIEKNIHSEDVTDAYNDYKVRQENAEKSRQRYMELLQKAHTIEEILRVEREIDRLTLEIEQLKGRLALLTDQTSYSTITVNVHEKAKPGVISYAFIGIYKGVKWLFVRG
ncbi:MAG: hypothetical protein FD123_278 [Bacteroidetes bacterium]|nr:MAG: hypothetical protein FD123_278 [Bacteroidota bacterium]